MEASEYGLDAQEVRRMRALRMHAQRRSDCQRTLSLLREYRHAQEEIKQLRNCGRAAVLELQAKEVNQQRYHNMAQAAGPAGARPSATSQTEGTGTGLGAAPSPEGSAEDTSIAHAQARESEATAFACALAPTEASLARSSEEKLQQFLVLSGTTTVLPAKGTTCSSTTMLSGTTSFPHEGDPHCLTDDVEVLMAAGLAAPDMDATGSNAAQTNPSTQFSNADPTVVPNMDSSHRLLVSLACTRLNAWEVRRMLAARDCSSISGLLERWRVALRLPSEFLPHLAQCRDARLPNMGCRAIPAAQQVAEGASLVHRARQDLLGKLHPDKNASEDSRLAAEAFVFMQEAVTGLLEHLDVMST